MLFLLLFLTKPRHHRPKTKHQQQTLRILYTTTNTLLKAYPKDIHEATTFQASLACLKHRALALTVEDNTKVRQQSSVELHFQPFPLCSMA
jgi:nitrate/nitrite-specific signal transduction histidine kinase